MLSRVWRRLAKGGCDLIRTDGGLMGGSKEGEVDHRQRDHFEHQCPGDLAAERTTAPRIPARAAVPHAVGSVAGCRKNRTGDRQIAPRYGVVLCTAALIQIKPCRRSIASQMPMRPARFERPAARRKAGPFGGSLSGGNVRQSNAYEHGSLRGAQRFVANAVREASNVRIQAQLHELENNRRVCAVLNALHATGKKS